MSSLYFAIPLIVVGVLIQLVDKFSDDYKEYIEKIPYLKKATFWLSIILIIFGGYQAIKSLIDSQNYAEDIAKKVVKKLPQQQKEESRPFFTAAPKLIVDKFNNIQSLDFAIINVGKGHASPMFGYSFIFQMNPIPTLIMHPQSFTNDIVVGITKIIHEPSIKMMELKGEQYVFLYLHYTDTISKKKYSQSFYFERVIYKNGLVEYSDASSEHKKEIDSIRKANCQVIEDLVNSGADERTFRSIMKEHGLEVRNITDF